MKLLFSFVFCLLVFSVLDLGFSEEAVADAGDDESKVKEASTNKAQKVKKKKSSKDWNKIKLDEVDKEWSNDDEDDDMDGFKEMEGSIKRWQQREGLGAGGAMPDLNDKDALASWVQKQKAKTVAGGLPSGQGTMVFIELNEKQADGSDWDKEDIDMLSAKWSAKLKYSQVEANFFNIGDKVGDNKLLVSIPKPWFYTDVMRFLSLETDVLKVTRDNKDYLREELARDLGEEL